MANYRKISGVNVKSYSADPDKTYPSAFEGQLYYNSSDGQFKFIGLGAGAWASGGNMNTGRYDGGVAARGTNTAGLIFGGEIYPPTSAKDETEEYNGTAWSEDGDLNAARRNRPGGLGIVTAALAVGGSAPNDAVESYNGSSWTETTEINTGGAYRIGIGLQGAGLVVGGTSGAAIVESWDGSSWTEVADLNTGRSCNSAGIQTAGLAISGNAPPVVTNVEEWNGSSWTEIADTNAGRSQAGAGGTTTDALFFGGGQTVASTEQWNGTTWTELADLATGRRSGFGQGSASTNNLYCGGDTYPATPAQTNITEEWTFAHAFKKVTTG
jgi:hypothetical protein